MKQKIKNLATLAAFLGTFAATDCVKHYHHYHPIEVREEPIEQQKLVIEIPFVVQVENKQTKTIEQKVRQSKKQVLEVPGKETIYETGKWYVIINSVRCAQQAHCAKQEGNIRLPYKVWGFKPVGANPWRGIGIGSSIIEVNCDGDTLVTGMSKGKAKEVLKEVKVRCYKGAYMDPHYAHEDLEK